MSDFVKFANNAKSTLASAISASATTLSVASAADANLFPIVDSSIDGTYFYATISDGTLVEIIRVGVRATGNATFSEVSRGQEGTSARVWPANTPIELRLTAGGLSDATPSVDIQHFFVAGSSTWAKPPGAKIVFVEMWGGGGGGGSGRRRATASQSSANACGGGGGAGGGYRYVWAPAASLPATVSLFVAGAALGGGARDINDSNGTNGQQGEGSTFGEFYCGGGGPGPSGSTGSSSTQSFGASSAFHYLDGVNIVAAAGRGGNGSATQGAGGGRALTGGGGGAGGGGYVTSGTASQNGGVGGAGGNGYQGGLNGSGGSSGQNGYEYIDPTSFDPTNRTMWIIGGGGGGGGSSSLIVSGVGAGGNGGHGGWPGGGGGGGAASQGANSGAGGNGAKGYIRVTTFF